MGVARKNARKRRERELSSRERVGAFFRALFRRGEAPGIGVPPDEPPRTSAGVVAVPLGPRPSADTAEAVPDPDDA
jgi:hypothetical protein